MYFAILDELIMEREVALRDMKIVKTQDRKPE